MWYSNLWIFDNCSGIQFFDNSHDGYFTPEQKGDFIPRFKTTQGEIYTLIYCDSCGVRWQCLYREQNTNNYKLLWLTTDLESTIKVINIKDGKVLLRGDFVLIVSKDWANAFRSGSKMLGRLEKEDVENLTVDEVRELARDYGYSAIMY